MRSSPERWLAQWSSGWSDGGKGLEMGGPPPVLALWLDQFLGVVDEPFLAAFYFARLCLSDL